MWRSLAPPSYTGLWFVVADAGVDERTTDRFILGLVALGCALGMLLWVTSWVPLWLAESLFVAFLFVAWHPSIAPSVEDGGEESSWVAHGKKIIARSKLTSHLLHGLGRF